jgi:ribosomal protein S18 acetylase RimI-like enzyme
LAERIIVRNARVADIPDLEAIIRELGLFTAEEAQGFAETLPGHFEALAAATQDGRLWLITGDGAGAAYLAPEPTPGVWNLLFLGVRPEARRRGAARALVAEVERRLRLEGARMLLIDTSTTPPMAAARAFYARLGYERVAEIPDNWAPGDGKLTFRRVL